MNSQSPLPNNEIARLNALRQYQILDTAPEKVFDDFTFLAAQICDTPIALISLMDGSRQWFKSKVGLTVNETSRDVAFCAYSILQQKPLVVRNALADRRFATNPLVTSDPNIRFYAGAPLITSDGFAIGTLCVIDLVPRDLSPEQVEGLRVLSDQVMAQFELRRNVITMSRTVIQRQQAAAELRHQHEFIEVLYRQGEDKARRGDYQGAIADFSQFLQIYPKGIKAYYSRGLARQNLGDYKGAMTDFDLYLKFNPNDAEARSNRGLMRSQLGDYKGAIADYSQAMSINPDYAVADSEQVFSELENKPEVSVNYTQSLQLNPTNPKVYTDVELEDDRGVIEDYTQPFGLNLDHAKAYISRGNARYEIEDYDGAIEDYTQSLQLNPNDAEAYLSRANARSKLKDFNGAIEDYTKFIEFNPHDANAYIRRGNARSKAKDHNGAREDYKRVWSKKLSQLPKLPSANN
ncbi:MAG: tetratricopeptide repeat protein [Cyanomargarita calcarea GSE-NOS-MK-12-04C]|jgi:tetratricopeptide (TPR) repeat protein|uniref:Tetratricopeptide repeat protein n=1 Tax=Cyanomargarita calcarea GSE-NOS-MK-12-04C TaxID=2839659 RepID=A0A951QTL1_9CYAN|nr:tetratricopeptide repeat protein [Cyanomargarita calcarea GSE-NOS-MK-12-04C]